MRWVSLLPAATAWIKAFHKTRSLVGRSHLEENDTEIRSLPTCTHYTLQTPRETWEAFLSPFPINIGTLCTLRPDAILTAFQPAIPDLDENTAISALQKAVGYPVKVFSIHAQSWEAYLSQARKIGQALEKSSLVEKILADAEKRRENLLRRTATLSQSVSAVVLTPSIPEVLVQIQGAWAAYFAPWVKMELGGVVAPFSSRVLRMEALIELDPEVIILAHPEASLERAGQMLATWCRQPAVQTLSAYRRKRLYAMEGLKALFWSGPNLIATAEALYEILHTPTYRFNKHLGTLWASLL